MRLRILTLLACVPLLAALAVLTLSTARATPETAAPGGQVTRPNPVAARVAAGAGVLVGAALAIAVLRRAPTPR